MVDPNVIFVGYPPVNESITVDRPAPRLERDQPFEFSGRLTPDELTVYFSRWADVESRSPRLLKDAQEALAVLLGTRRPHAMEHEELIGRLR